MDAENPFVKYPPPWHAVRNAGRGTWAVIAFGRHGTDVTVLVEVPDERTARVVAAAPEMLDLLTRLRTYLRPWADGLGKLLARYDELVSSLGAETDAMPPDAPADPKAAGYVGESPTPPGRPDPDLVREVYRRADDPIVPEPIPFDPPPEVDLDAPLPPLPKMTDNRFPCPACGSPADLDPSPDAADPGRQRWVCPGHSDGTDNSYTPCGTVFYTRDCPVCRGAGVKEAGPGGTEVPCMGGRLACHKGMVLVVTPPPAVPAVEDMPF